MGNIFVTSPNLQHFEKSMCIIIFDGENFLMKLSQIANK